MTTSYRVMPGPEHFLPPSASSMGIRLPDPGQAHIHGTIVSEEEAMEQAAREFLSAKVPTIFPGPLVLWAWNEKAAKKAKAVRHLYETIKECVDPKSNKPCSFPCRTIVPNIPRSIQKLKLTLIIQISPFGITKLMPVCLLACIAIRPISPSKSFEGGRAVIR